MHFPLWIYFSMYQDICGITVFVGCPFRNANAPAGLDEDTAFLPLLACCGSNDRTFNGWPGCRTPPWYFNFEKIKLLIHYIMKIKDFGMCTHTVLVQFVPRAQMQSRSCVPQDGGRSTFFIFISKKEALLCCSEPEARDPKDASG